MASDAFNKALASYNKNGYAQSMQERFPQEPSALSKVKSEALSLSGKASDFINEVFSGNDNKPAQVSSNSNNNILDETYNTVVNSLKRNESPLDKYTPSLNTSQIIEGPLEFKDLLKSKNSITESPLNISTSNIYNRGDMLMSQETYNKSLPWYDRAINTVKDIGGNVADTVKTALFQMGLTLAKPIDRVTNPDYKAKSPEEQKAFEDSLLRDTLGKAQNWTPEDDGKNIKYAQKAGGIAGDLVGLTAGTVLTGNPIVGAALWGGTSAYGQGGNAFDVAKGAASNAAFMAVAGPVTKVFEGVGSGLLRNTPDILKNSLIADVANKFIAGGIGGAAGTIAGNQIYQPGTMPGFEEILDGAAMNAFFHGIPGAINSVNQSRAVKGKLQYGMNELYKNLNEMHKTAQATSDINVKSNTYRRIVSEIDNSLNALSKNRYIGNNKEVQNLKEVLNYGKNNINDMLSRWNNLNTNTSLGSGKSNTQTYQSGRLYLTEGQRFLPQGKSMLLSQESSLKIQPTKINESNMIDFLPKRNTFDNMVRNLPPIENRVQIESELSTPGIQKQNNLPSANIDSRNYNSVGNRSVMAIQQDFPKLKPFIQTEANRLLTELRASQKGRRIAIKDEDGYIAGYKGESRVTSEAIERILDNLPVKPSYKEIEVALRKIVKDGGAENNALSKRIELVIDDNLTYGTRDINGHELPKSDEYIRLKGGSATSDATESPLSFLLEQKASQPSTKIFESSIKTRSTIFDAQNQILPTRKETKRQLPDTIEELENTIKEMENNKLKLIPIDLQLFSEANKKLTSLRNLEKLKKQKSELISQAKELDSQSKYRESGKVYENILDIDKQIFNSMKELNREVPYASRYIRKIDNMKKGFEKRLSDQKYIDTWKLILQRKEAKDLLRTKLSEQKEAYEGKLENIKNESRAKISDLKNESRAKIEDLKNEAKTKQEDMKKDFKYRLKKQKYDMQQKYKISKERKEYIEWWKEKVDTERSNYVSWWGEQLKKRDAEIKKERNKIYSKLKDINRKVNEMRPEYKKLIQSILSDIDLGVKNKRSKKTIAKLERLREYIQNNPDNTIPEDVLSKLTILSKKSFGDFTIEELRTIYRSVAHFVHLNQLKNSLIIKRKVYDMKNDLNSMLSNIMKKAPKISEFENILDSQTASNYDKLNNKHRLKELTIVSHYNPEMLSQVLDQAENGPIKQYFYDNFNEATNVKIEFEDASRKHFRDGLKSIDENWEAFSEIFSPKIKNVEYQEIKLPSNRTIKITKAQRVSLYLHSLNTDNMRHIILGGIRLPKKTGWTPYKLSLEDFQTIIRSMTSNELKVAKLVNEYFDTISKDGINKVSVDLYGYELADVKNYFPINSDSSYVERNLIKPKTTYLKDIIENFGFTKVRTKGSNPILLRDVFDVVLDSIDKVGTFIGFAEPVRNARYILSNVDFKNTLIRHYGNEYLRYLEKYVDDIESIDYTPSPILDNFRRNADTALLALNPWVIAKQPISYVMASTEIDSKYLTQALTRKPSYEEINKYSPQLRRRLEGDISPEMGELGEFNKPRSFFLNTKKPIRQRLTDGILAADKLIIGRIWEAVKLETKENYPNLTPGEFFEIVAQRAEEIVRRTNSVFEVKDRTAIGRSKNEIFKTFLRFSSQRFVMLNALRRALLRYSLDGNKSRFFHSMLVLVVVQSLLLQSVNTFRDWFLGRETNDSIASWILNIGKDTASLIGGIGEAINTLSYALKTNRGTELSAPSLDIVADLLTGIKDSIIAVNQFINNDVYKSSNRKTDTYKGETKWEKTATKAIDELASVFSRVKGLPYISIKNLIKGLYNKINSD